MTDRSDDAAGRMRPGSSISPIGGAALEPALPEFVHGPAVRREGRLDYADGLRLPIGTNLPSLTAMIVTSLSGARVPVGEVRIAGDAGEGGDGEDGVIDRLRAEVGRLVHGVDHQVHGVVAEAGEGVLRRYAIFRLVGVDELGDERVVHWSSPCGS